MNGFHAVNYPYVGVVTVSRGNEKLTETISKNLKKSELATTDNVYHFTASAHLMPDFTDPRAHNDRGTIYKSSFEH